MQYIGKASSPPNEVWIEDNGILYMKMRGVHDAKRDVDIHKVLANAADVIKPTERKTRMLIDMDELEGLTVNGRLSSYRLLNKFGAPFVAFAATDSKTEMLIKIVASAMNGDYRCFDTVDQARAWLLTCA